MEAGTSLLPGIHRNFCECRTRAGFAASMADGIPQSLLFYHGLVKKMPLASHAPAYVTAPAVQSEHRASIDSEHPCPPVVFGVEGINVQACRTTKLFAKPSEDCCED